MTTESFLRAVSSAARDVPGLHPTATAAHAAVESAYGRSGLARDANNLHGVKAMGTHTPYWTGDRITLPTWEVVGGARVEAVAHFRAYPSWAAALGDYADIIRRVYPGAHATSATAFLAGIFLVGPRRWATDPAAYDKAARVLGAYAHVLDPKEEGAWGVADTFVLTDLRLAERWVALTRGPAVLRGRYAWRVRGGRVDVRSE